MNLAIVIFPLHASCNYRSAPVAVPLGRWRRYLLFHPLCRLQCRRYEYAIGPSKIIGIPITSSFTNPCRKVQTQIPIALLLILTLVIRPAVSSLEACQTPAR